MNLMVGTPCYGGTVTVPYMKSYMRMQDLLEREGIKVGLLTTEHESLITRARNYIANEFLRQSEYSHLLFIDSDIGFPPEAALRYLRSGKDVVCGVYPAKVLNLDKLRRLQPELPPAEAEAVSLTYTAKLMPTSRLDEEGLVTVRYAPTGFMLIRRHVFGKIAEANPGLRYKRSYVATNDHEHENYAFFDTAIDPETLDYLPEDYAFCNRWTALGGEIHADVHSRFTHIGSRAYAGDYHRYLAHAGLLK